MIVLPVQLGKQKAILKCIYISFELDRGLTLGGYSLQKNGALISFGPVTFQLGDEEIPLSDKQEREVKLWSEHKIKIPPA